MRALWRPTGGRLCLNMLATAAVYGAAVIRGHHLDDHPRRADHRLEVPAPQISAHTDLGYCALVTTVARCRRRRDAIPTPPVRIGTRVNVAEWRRPPAPAHSPPALRR